MDQSADMGCCVAAIFGFRPTLGCYNYSDGLLPATFTRDTVGKYAWHTTWTLTTHAKRCWHSPSEAYLQTALHIAGWPLE